jgi:hypothetical protein
MTRIIRTLTVGALVAGIGILGPVPVPAAAESIGSTTGTVTTTGGAESARSTTNGSTAIHTSPRTSVRGNAYNAGLLWNPLAD